MYQVDRALCTGCGLCLDACQAGAIARARRGESRDAILAHYYRGAAVATLGAAGAAE